MAVFTRLFPIWAIVVTGIAYIQPDIFTVWRGAIVPLLTMIMFTMGMTLRFADFKSVIQNPAPIAVGTVLQFSVMPLAAFMIANLFALEKELLIGLVLVGCCPGGTASNVVCYLAKGSVALSISLTMVSTLLSVVLTPLLTWFYLGEAIDVPMFTMMMSIFQIVIIPVLGGLVINSLWGDKFQKLTSLFPAIAVIAIVIIIGIVVALNRENFALMGVTVFIAVIIHNVTGLGCAYSVCKLLKYDERICRTIAIEVGMQNSGLGVALATQFFSTVAALPGAVFSLWHNLSGSLLASFWSRKSTYSSKVSSNNS